MKGPGMILAIGAPKDKPQGDSDESAERTYAREAFSAFKDDDEDGFVDAFLGAVKACVKKDYGDEDDEEAPDSEG